MVEPLLKDLRMGFCFLGTDSWWILLVGLRGLSYTFAAQWDHPDLSPQYAWITSEDHADGP